MAKKSPALNRFPRFSVCTFYDPKPRRAVYQPLN
jgi:hypothetical protein